MKSTICGAVILVGAMVYGTAATNEYKHIPGRNSFGLQEPKQPQVQPPTPQPAALPKLTLTGITTILGDKRALLKAHPPSKPGEAANQEESYILSEGQKEGFLEVLEIDEEEGRVRLVNSGVPLTLTIERDAPQPPLGTNQAQVAGALGIPPLPGALSPTGNPQSSPYGRRTDAQSTAATVTNGSATNMLPAIAAALTNNLDPSGVAARPSRVEVPVPVPVFPPAPGVVVDPRLSAEEQAILAEVQRELLRQGSTQTVTPPNSGLPVTGSGRGLVPPTASGNLPSPGAGTSIVPPNDLPPTGALSPGTVPGQGTAAPNPLPSRMRRQ